MKLQELSLVSEEDVKVNEHLRSLLARANADRERLQAELERSQQSAGRPQVMPDIIEDSESRCAVQGTTESSTEEVGRLLAEVGIEGYKPQSVDEANDAIKATIPICV